MYQKILINDFRQFHNQSILFGKYLTVLSGRNSTGKSTILGMIANSGELKKKDGVTYSSRAFRAEFSELFKGSRQFDTTGSDRFKIFLSDEAGIQSDYRSFRTAWQTRDSYRKKVGPGATSDTATQRTEDSSKKTLPEDRFRVIPLKKLEGNKKTEAKFTYPVIYLGLSRLFPIGESQGNSISSKSIVFNSDTHRKWFVDKYKSILSMQNDVVDVTNYSIGETDKKSGIGVSTKLYDYLTNSSGQDNLGQILLALLSFRRLKEEQGDVWQGGILLIDEIDATLHPAAQNKLIQLLLQEGRENKVQSIITTHSLSFLQDICCRTSHNCHDENVNNPIELYYLTNANRKLEIKRNPHFTEIESDLLIISDVQNTKKIKLYTEDAEARWFLKYLVPDYLDSTEILDIRIGCDQLINLFNADNQYFGNTLIVFDGDVTGKQLSKIPQSVRDNLGNLLILPGEKSLEELLYQYLLSLDSDHEYWYKEARRVGFTWDYFNEHGPTSNDYTQEKDRERCKQWFINHQKQFENTKLIDYWIRDNRETVEKFQKDFFTAYNHIAKRMMVKTIESRVTQ